MAPRNSKMFERRISVRQTALRGSLEVFDSAHPAGQWVPSGQNLVRQTFIVCRPRLENVSKTGVDSSGLLSIPAERMAISKLLMRNDLDQNSCAISQLTKYQKAGSTPAAATSPEQMQREPETHFSGQPVIPWLLLRTPRFAGHQISRCCQFPQHSFAGVVKGRDD